MPLERDIMKPADDLLMSFEKIREQEEMPSNACNGMESTR